jgi:hypothetical protein
MSSENREDFMCAAVTVIFGVVTAVVMKSSIFWDIMPSSLLKIN